MATMNISLPDTMKAFIDERVADEGFGTSSEYIRALVRQEQQRAKLREMLLEGMRSPITGVADDAYFEGLRARIRSGS